MKLLKLIILLNISLCYSQKAYKFDTLLEYECLFKKNNKDSITTQYIFINSKDNSYSALIREADSLNYSLEFIDYKNYHSKVKVNKAKLFSAAEIDLSDCTTVHKHNNDYNYRIKEYDFVNLKDTVLKKDTLKSYKSVYLKSFRKKKRNKIGDYHFIVAKNTQKYQPVLLHPTLYNEWYKERNIPNGLYQELIFTNYKGIIESVFKLVDVKQTSVTLYATAPCPLKIKIIN